MTAGSGGGIRVIIPARNERSRIEATVVAARTLPGVAEVIVVDDASRDGTADVASRAGARVLRLARRQGKGGALEAGIAATATAEILLFLDADLEATAADAEALIGPVLAGDADMTVAVLPAVGPRQGGWGIVVRLARWAIRRRTGRRMAAPLSGQRCVRRTVLTAARPLARGFGVETALTLDALQAGFRVREIPTAMQHRVTGRDLRGCLHRVGQLYDICLALLNRAAPRGVVSRMARP